MVKEITITVNPEEEEDKAKIALIIQKELTKLGVSIEESKKAVYVCKKRSVDARRRQVKIHLRYEAFIGESPEEHTSFNPKWQKADPQKRVIIVGSGPAGLFAALRLLEAGITPIIIERGPDTHERKIDIASISRTGAVGSDSNYCFGLGGAGTFSDGKLYTRSNKRGDISKILAILNHHGAEHDILSDSHPHIGTNKLPFIINEIKNTIEKFGGVFYINTKCVDIIVEEKNIVKGVKVVSTIDSQEQNIMASHVVLACGHSSPEIYQMLDNKSKLLGLQSALEAKTFAIGVRVEHPRKLIDKIQYHGDVSKSLSAAEYRLTTQVDGRGVYSFCMCPGGLVVPSSTSPDSIVVNGMSPSDRNSKWSNSAIVVETRYEDIPLEFQKAGSMAGLLYRTYIEKEAYKNGGGINPPSQKAPAQRLVDFLNGKKSESLPESSYTPGLVSSSLDSWLPRSLVSRLKAGFKNFGQSMKGFCSEEALLIAPETRTSTPVRICRDKDTYQSTVYKNLYPAGEGSGYAGGIVSSAMDGENVAEAIISCF